MADVLRVHCGLSIDVGALYQWNRKWSNRYSFVVYVFEQPISCVQRLLSPCQDFNGKTSHSNPVHVYKHLKSKLNLIQNRTICRNWCQ